MHNFTFTFTAESICISGESVEKNLFFVGVFICLTDKFKKVELGGERNAQQPVGTNT